MVKKGSRWRSDFIKYGASLSHTWWLLSLEISSGRLTRKQLRDMMSKVTCLTVARPRGERLVFDGCAQVAGVAVVHTDQEVTLIGRRDNIDSFLNFWPTRSDGWQRRQSHGGHLGMRQGTREWGRDRFIEEIRLAPDCPGDPAYLLVHDEWLAIRQIQHKVAEIFPALREDRPSAIGEPEVILRPHHGGLRLGGCVWRPEAYASQEGRAFLGPL